MKSETPFTSLPLTCYFLYPLSRLQVGLYAYIDLDVNVPKREGARAPTAPWLRRAAYG